MRLIHCSILKLQDKPILRTCQKSALQHSLFWRYVNFSKIMRTIHTSMTSTFILNLSHLLNVKHCTFSHWNVLVLHICIVHINLEKLADNVKPWMLIVPRIFDRFTGQVCLEISRCCTEWINLNESLRHYYINYEDYVNRFVRVVSDIQKAAPKSPNFEWSCS